ncbi:MAG: DoxX family membrane protein, partial [Sporichthyaceae bacterium]|nr:DoxX family membrane protein [Sporichthyaceae bacterium]
MADAAEATARPTAQRAPASLVAAAKGLAAFRIFTGLIFGVNGLAKLIEKNGGDLGPVSFGLIPKQTARGLLTRYAGPESHAAAPLKWFYNEIVLAHWTPWSYFLTATELLIGVCLVLGIASRLGALAGFLLIFPLQVMVIDNHLYLFEFPVDWVP